MKKHAIMIDFGSTFTKVVVVDLIRQEIILSDKFPSTVHTDARVGLAQCFDAARACLTEEEFEDAMKLSTSSAAGGLRMAVIGLTRSLSIMAGRETVFGAGAKVMGTFSGLLDEEKIQELEALDLEIILFCGGYENGNVTMVLKNAELLASSRIHVPVVYSGNTAIAKDVRRLMMSHKKECFIIDNILPGVGQINIEPSQEIIRHLFMQRITNMKGLSGVKDALGDILMPTPAAVLAAGELLSQGTETEEGLGDLMMVDVGGATTDIYSFNVNHAYEGSILVGIAEPYGKRTVEGDMGMRESSVCIQKEVGSDKLAELADLSVEAVESGIRTRITTTSYLADSPEEFRLDHSIAEMAVYVSARRHAGKLEYRYSGNCETIQLGKNLTEITTIIGTGGPVVNSPHPEEILRQALKTEKDSMTLLPLSFDTYIDKEYVFFAAGLLREYDPDTALKIMKKSITKI